MSSLPGYNLEDFVMWYFDLIVDDNRNANQSLKIAEALGIKTRRISITVEQFKPILVLFEPWRNEIEEHLSDFDEEYQSWRDYAGYSFDFIPNEIFNKANKIIKRY